MSNATRAMTDVPAVDAGEGEMLPAAVPVEGMRGGRGRRRWSTVLVVRASR
jgi:hypothetical protein